MEEIKINNQNQSKSISERLSELETTVQGNGVKTRKFRVPRRGKLSKSQTRKGYCTIMRIDDNKNVDFEKRQIEDSTYRLKSGTYHTSDEDDILTYKGKPFVIQPVKKLNPYNPLEGANETYGQKYVMARMLGDAIKMVNKKKGGAFLWIILGVIVIGAVYFIIKNKHAVGV